MTKLVTYYDHDENSGQSKMTLEQMLSLFDKMDWKEHSNACFPITEEIIFDIRPEKNELILKFTNDAEMLYYEKNVGKAECRRIITEVFAREILEPSMLYGFKTIQITKPMKSWHEGAKQIYALLFITCIIIAGLYAWVLYHY